MSQVGIYFAKMLLAKERANEAAQADKQALSKRAFAELSTCLEENVEALNSFPGVERKIITVDKVSRIFKLRGANPPREVLIRIEDDKLYLERIDQDVVKQTVEEKLLRDIFDEPEIEDGDCAECYQIRWSDLGVKFVSDNGGKWVQLNVDQVLSRAFGIVINGMVSPLFTEVEED